MLSDRYPENPNRLHSTTAQDGMRPKMVLQAPCWLQRMCEHKLAHNSTNPDIPESLFEVCFSVHNTMNVGVPNYQEMTTFRILPKD